MLNIKNSRIKMIEELYLGIQLMLILFCIFTFYHIPTKMLLFDTKIIYLFILYSIYLILSTILFVRKAYFKDNFEIHANLYFSFIDGIFLTIFLYFSKENFYPVFHLFYIYIALQAIRFYDKNSFLFSTFVSICYIFVVFIQNPKDFISFEFIMNIFSFYLLSYILSSIINEIYRLETQIHFILKDLKEKNTVLNEIATKDYLTNMYNHKSFYKYLKDIIKSSETKNTPFSLTILDIDNFKKVNDIYGHLVGDSILKEISSIIHNNIRKTDIAARYGGEEFAIIFPNASVETATNICERIRKSIADHTFCVQEHKVKITISGGLGSAIISPASSSQINFVGFVDQLLYEAKHLGKNQIQCAKETLCLD